MVGSLSKHEHGDDDEEDDTERIPETAQAGSGEDLCYPKGNRFDGVDNREHEEESSSNRESAVETVFPRLIEVRTVPTDFVFLSPKREYRPESSQHLFSHTSSCSVRRALLRREERICLA